MIKAICNAISIFLEGSIFRRAAKKGILNKNKEVMWALEGVSQCAPYVLTQEEYIIKNDLISKLHSASNGLQEEREGARRSRAKWFKDLNEQLYQPALRAPAPDPHVEVYFKTLGKAFMRDPRITLTDLPAR